MLSIPVVLLLLVKPMMIFTPELVVLLLLQLAPALEVLERPSLVRQFHRLMVEALFMQANSP